MRKEAPFTEEEVKAINQWQTAGKFHPFTCCGQPYTLTAEDVGTHTEYIGMVELHRDERCPDYGELVATTSGLVCPCGKYTQDWVHDFMAK